MNKDNEQQKDKRVVFDPGKSGENPPYPQKMINDKKEITEDNIEDLMGVFDEEVEQVSLDDSEDEDDEQMTGLVLLSGGMDSVAALGWAIDNDIKTTALIIDYGASNSKQEVKAAKKAARHYKVPYHLIKLRVPVWDKGLTAENPDIYHKDSKPDEVAGEYVPARNTIFLSYAYAYAERYDLDSIIVGFNAGVEESGEDEEFGYMPDTSPVYCRAWQYVINTSTSRPKYTISLMAPFLRSTKKDIAVYCHEHKVPLKMSYSCFKGEEKSCGVCRTCVARLRAFEEAGLEDPLEYQTKDFYHDIPEYTKQIKKKEKKNAD